MRQSRSLLFDEANTLQGGVDRQDLQEVKRIIENSHRKETNGTLGPKYETEFQRLNGANCMIKVETDEDTKSSQNLCMGGYPIQNMAIDDSFGIPKITKGPLKIIIKGTNEMLEEVYSAKNAWEAMYYTTEIGRYVWGDSQNFTVGYQQGWFQQQFLELFAKNIQKERSGRDIKKYLEQTQSKVFEKYHKATELGQLARRGVRIMLNQGVAEQDQEYTFDMSLLDDRVRENGLKRLQGMYNKRTNTNYLPQRTSRIKEQFKQLQLTFITSMFMHQKDYLHQLADELSRG